MKIIIDAMGGDHAPFAPVAAAAKASLETDAVMVLVLAVPSMSLMRNWHIV